MDMNLQSRPVTRRRFALGGVLCAASLALLPTRSMLAAAQSTPEAGMNYPELKVTITEQELRVSATEIPAGYVLLTVVNQSKNANSAGLIGPGPGQTLDQLRQLAATPPANEDEIPPLFLNATILGGPGDVQPGQAGQAIIKVPEGGWAVFEETNLPPVVVTAKTSDGSNQREPRAAVTVTEVDFAFGGFDVPIPVGKQIWKVVNQGKQQHMLIVFQVPSGTTVAQVLALAMQEGNATPVPGGLSEQDVTDVSPAGVILQSTGTTVWPIMDLPAGHYAAVCWWTDKRNGQPHIMEGMLAVFDVGHASAPAATPAG